MALALATIITLQFGYSQVDGFGVYIPNVGGYHLTTKINERDAVNYMVKT